MTIGELITHQTHGEGTVLALMSQGIVEVQFGKTVRYVELKNLAFLRQREIYQKQRNEERLASQRQRDSYDFQRRRNEAKRSERLESIRKAFRNNFLTSESYFRSAGDGLISEAEFAQEKISFVQTWISDYLGAAKGGKHQPPDDEQASAIAAVNGHVQVVARAGSGKTTTLVNRTLFLLKHCGVAPSQMLLLAFNRKAVQEIRRRLLGLLSDGAEAAVVEEVIRRRLEAGKKNRSVLEDIESSTVDAIAAKRNVALPHVMTFHALAHSTVHPEEAILFNGAEGESQGLSRVFQDVIKDHLQLPEFHHRIRALMLAHFREDWDRIVDGGYDQSKEELLKFRRSLPRESLGGDYVKSYGEKVIADFLFEHDIAYKYERNHWWSGINYRPDFTIFMDKRRRHVNGVIIEYFGLAGGADYDEMSVAKRKYWAGKKEWSLVEVTPIDITVNGVDAFRLQLQARLEKLGVPCVRLSEDEIWHRIGERAIYRFTKSVVGFISRCRKRSWSPPELQAHIDTHVARSPAEPMFLELAHRLYAAYLNRLSATGEDDFDGLMQRASENINAGQTSFQRKSGNGDLNAVRYICIDEFQDFSDLFFRLLTAIRKQNPNVELFCVGDDWQAINGFAGSDLGFFQDFQKYFGESRNLDISTNYRSSRSIVDIGNALMHGLGQPSVADKKSAGRVLLSDLNQFEPTLLEKQRHTGDSLTPAVLRVSNQGLVDGLDVVLLCRRNGLPYFVSYGEDSGVEGRGIDRFLAHVRSFFPRALRERITISTAHKYKGLEKSVVIVLDAVARSYPLIHPDWVFARIFGDSPAKITQEERRLLYVALTRAIDTLIVFTEGRGKSPFLEDIEKQMKLQPLDWAVFPSVASISGNRLVVQVKNQPDVPFEIGTFAVKNQLMACRYNWHAVNELWEKSFPADGFSFDIVRNEVWATAACRVDISVVDDSETEIASYSLDLGAWTCRFDNIGIAKENSLDVPLEAVK
jgi:DNA helicase IV